MKLTGIIAEFNPFHNGHAKLINSIKNDTDGIVAIMSGNFAQRGEPTIFSKFDRSRTALSAGIDIVCELPVCYSLQSADGFAYGGVSLLGEMGVDEIIFGSECGDIGLLESIAETSLKRSKDINTEIRAKMAEGIPYATAKLSSELKYNPDAEILKFPNNLLGAEYIKAIIKNDINIAFRTIKRESGGNDNPSAADIRKNLINGLDISNFIPEHAINEYAGHPVVINDFFDTILYILRTEDSEKIKNIQGVSEGFENKLKEAAGKSYDMNSFMDIVLSRRYTEKRIKRILCSLLIGITKQDIQDSYEQQNHYSRILGFKKANQRILAEIAFRSVIPVITRSSEINKQNPIAKKDVIASDIYYIATRQNAGKDFTEKIISV